MALYSQTPPTAKIVVDASIAIKWYLPEVYDTKALRLLSGHYILLVPDLLFPEVGSILRKRIRSGEMTDTEGEAVLQALGKLPLIVHPSWPLILSALEIAYRSSRTVYDSLYLALAVQENTKLVTADERLYNALTSTPLAAHLLWVEHIV